MAWEDVTKSHYQYTSDDGTVFRMRYANYIATQNNAAAASKVGATLATGSEPKLPGGHYIRRAICRDLVGLKDRVVGILLPSAPIIAVPRSATPADYTLTLNYASTGTSASFTYQGQFLTETRGRRA